MKKFAKSLFFVVVGINGFLFQTANAGISISDSQGAFNTHLQNSSITGFVFDESRRPVSEVYVELLNDVYSTVAQTRTAGSGLYSFRGLSDGQYSIRVSPYGKNYEAQTRSVTLLSVSLMPGRSGSSSEQVDFYLKSKRTANIGPLAAPGVVFAQNVPKDAEKLYEAGIEDLIGSKEKEGFEKLKRAIEIFPNYFLALDRLGTEYVLRGYYEAAYVLLTKALEVNPRSFSSRFGLGLAQFRLQQADEAISNLKQSTEIYNESIDAHLWLGVALHSKGKLTEALAALLRANKLSKGKAAEVHWQLARVYKDQKSYNDAANELELFLKYKPDAQNADGIKETIKALRQKGNAQQ